MHDDTPSANAGGLTGEAAKIWIDGHAVQATTDMSVAAAIMLGGLWQTRRSVSGQVRFALCGMGVCQECRVRINGQAHRLACQVRCHNGMVVHTDVGSES